MKGKDYFFLIDKDPGMTSFDVIRKVKPYLFDMLGRGKGKNKLKIGHMGTLDPFASGLLLVGTGKALRLMNVVHELLTKQYIAGGIYGVQTLTGDIDGEVVKTQQVSFNKDEFIKVKNTFVGEYMQRPSHFSAVKHEGKPLYEYARQGIFIDKEPVKRTIFNCDYLAHEDCKVSFSCEVSTGTYIRKLWEDMCGQLNTVGHLKSLRRSAIGHLKVEKATKLDQLHTLKAVCVDEVIPLPQYIVESGDDCEKLRHGGDIKLDNISEAPLVWLKDTSGLVLALGQKIKTGLYRPAVNFMPQ